MTPVARQILLLQCCSLLLCWTALTGCSSPDVGAGGRITKVNYYHLLPEKPLNSNDPAIQFERDRHLYGAVTREEILGRGGHYYTVFWKATDRSLPVTVRFEYRQANSRLSTRRMEEIVPDVRGANVTRFQVIGDAYKTDGRVTAWRVSLRRGDQELASHESFLWN